MPVIHASNKLFGVLAQSATIAALCAGSLPVAKNSLVA